MDVLELFLREHASVHSKEAAGGDFSIDWLLADLTEAQWRTCPHGFNSIAWIFWHLARVEDGCLSIMVAGEPQLYDADRGARLRVDRRGDGEGMSKAEVAALSDAIDIGALQAYRNDVGRRTRAHASALWPTRWTEPIAEADVQRGIDAGIYHLGQASMIRAAVLEPGASRA